MIRHTCLLSMFSALLFLSHGASGAEITISKAKRTLQFQGDGVFETFKIGLGTSPVGRKLAQGDRRTPEGIYAITHKNPKSQFYLSLGLNYPNVEDANRGLRSGLISELEHSAMVRALQNRTLPPQNTSLGGDIFIHGRGAASDWTWGCIAVSDRDMDFLYNHVRIGDKVTILP